MSYQKTEPHAQPSKATLGLPTDDVDNARDRAFDRCIHIENDTVRALAIRGVMPEEGASKALEVVEQWLLDNHPEVVTGFRSAFSRK